MNVYISSAAGGMCGIVVTPPARAQVEERAG